MSFKSVLRFSHNGFAYCVVDMEGTFSPDTMTFDDWQRVIQQKWNDLFSHVADDFGYVDIWVCW